MLRGLLELPGAAADPQRASNLRALRCVLVAHASVRTWSWVLAGTAPGLVATPLYTLPTAIALTIAAVAVWSNRRRMAASRVAAALVSVEFFLTVLGAANHVGLEWVALALFALLDEERDDEAVLLQSSVAWVAALVLFHSGLQKVWHGHYFGGEFLAWAIAGREQFADAMRYLVPAGELTRLQTLDALREGSGPFRPAAPMLVVASNLVWMLEVAIAVLLLSERTRNAAAWGGIAFVLALQLPAREIHFALLFAALMTTWIGAPGMARLRPLWIGAYAYLLAHSFGLVPGEFLVKRMGS